LLHSEEYPNFADADAARELFWERILKIAASNAVFRVWTQERSPFWARLGFLTADAEIFSRLPDEWKNADETWFTLELKNEAVINAALKNQFSGFSAAEKKSAEEVVAQSKKVMTVVTVFCFVIFFICLAVLVFLLTRRRVDDRQASALLLVGPTRRKRIVLT